MDVFTQREAELVVGFGPETPSLVISCLPGHGALYLHPSFSRARRNSAPLFPLLCGRRIQEVSIHPSDRILLVALEGDLRLLVRMFHADSNVLLLDPAGTVTDSFLHPRRLRGTRLLLEDPSTGPDPLEALDAALGGEAATYEEALRKTLPTLGSRLLSEVLHRSAVSGPPSPERVHAAAAAVLAELETPAPLVYRREEAPLFSPIILLQFGEEAPFRFEDVHEAIRFVHSRRDAGRFLEEKKKPLVQAARTRLERTRRALGALEAAQTEGSRAGHYERWGHLLLTHLPSLGPGAASVRLPDGEGETEIPLEPGLSAAQNAGRFFSKARAAREREKHGLARRAHLEAALRREEEAVAALDQARSVRALREAGAAISPRTPQPGTERIPFRVFRVEGGFEVWAGKNGANNDLLTLRYARPGDLWFHARGSGGSHVILRTATARGEPGRKALEEAAAIAAHYSRMRKAQNVPVAFTLRKHVRKPKGAPAGTVLLERERVLFVRPGLPKGAEDT
ncbi:MAG: NFACT RNA binding domain-containing protein [Bacteroidota bacterium]